MRDRIRKILKEARLPINGTSIPDKWVDGNTRAFFDSGGIKYRVIFPWNHATNGTIRTQIIPYNKEDAAVWDEYKDLGPYGQDAYHDTGIINEWKSEIGSKLYNNLNSFIGSNHNWSVRKTQEEYGVLIYANLNVFELVEDYFHMADDGDPFSKIK
jgi:hypothetical protein